MLGLRLELRPYKSKDNKPTKILGDILNICKDSPMVSAFCTVRMRKPSQVQPTDLFWLNMHSSSRARIPIVDENTAIELCTRCKKYGKECPALDTIL